MKRKILLALCCLVLTSCDVVDELEELEEALEEEVIQEVVDDAPNSLNKAELLSLVNEARSVSRNCGGTIYPAASEVQWSDVLEQAAQGHSDDMYQNDFFAHEGSNGSDPGDRLDQVGYTWQAYNENIAKGYPTEESVIEGWLTSSGHCRNIMNSDMTEMAVATTGSYWTQMFARPR